MFAAQFHFLSFIQFSIYLFCEQMFLPKIRNKPLRSLIVIHQNKKDLKHLIQPSPTVCDGEEVSDNTYPTCMWWWEKVW